MYESILFLHGKQISVTYLPGTFGNFIKFFVEKYSKKTPAMAGDPFTAIGTSHNHGSDNSDVEGEEFVMEGLPCCIVIPETDIDLLYLEHSQLYRVNDNLTSPDELWTKPIGEMPSRLMPDLESIMSLYDIKDKEPTSKIPKFIVRDFYKLSFFNNRERKRKFELMKIMRNKKFYEDQNTFEFRLDAFYDREKFMAVIKDMDRILNLDLDFTKEEEMIAMFDKGFDLDKIRKECKVVTQTLAKEKDLQLADLSVITEAFIYAQLEKANPDIPMPLVNDFFTNTNEIQAYLDNFPGWYRRSNPNLG